MQRGRFTQTDEDEGVAGMNNKIEKRCPNGYHKDKNGNCVDANGNYYQGKQKQEKEGKEKKVEVSSEHKKNCLKYWSELMKEFDKSSSFMTTNEFMLGLSLGLGKMKYTEAKALMNWMVDEGVLERRGDFLKVNSSNASKKKGVKKMRGDSFEDENGNVLYVDLMGGYNFTIKPVGSQYQLIFHNGGYIGGDKVDMGMFNSVERAMNRADELGATFSSYYASTKKSKKIDKVLSTNMWGKIRNFIKDKYGQNIVIDRYAESDDYSPEGDYKFALVEIADYDKKNPYTVLLIRVGMTGDWDISVEVEHTDLSGNECDKVFEEQAYFAGISFNKSTKKSKGQNHSKSMKKSISKRYRGDESDPDWDAGAGRWKTGGDTHVKIYQISGKNLRGMPEDDPTYQYYMKHKWHDNKDDLDLSYYDQTWEGDMNVHGKLEDLYGMMQEYRPIETSRTIYSLSVGDLVEMNGKLYMVDDFGFSEVTNIKRSTKKSKVAKADMTDKFKKVITDYIKRYSDDDFELGDYTFHEDDDRVTFSFDSEIYELINYGMDLSEFGGSSADYSFRDGLEEALGKAGIEWEPETASDWVCFKSVSKSTKKSTGVKKWKQDWVDSEFYSCNFKYFNDMYDWCDKEETIHWIDQQKDYILNHYKGGEEDVDRCIERMGGLDVIRGVKPANVYAIIDARMKGEILDSYDVRRGEGLIESTKKQYVPKLPSVREMTTKMRNTRNYRMGE